MSRAYWLARSRNALPSRGLYLASFLEMINRFIALVFRKGTALGLVSRASTCVHPYSIACRNGTEAKRPPSRQGSPSTQSGGPARNGMRALALRRKKRLYREWAPRKGIDLACDTDAAMGTSSMWESRTRRQFKGFLLISTCSNRNSSDTGRSPASHLSGLANCALLRAS